MQPRELAAGRQQYGFTLIELMITLVVLAILLLLGTNLTRSWIDRSQVDGGMASVKNAVSQAKSAALRNTNNQPTSYAAASVCFDSNNNTLNVVRAASQANNACLITTEDAPEQNYILNRFALAKGVTLKVGNADFECLSFNSAGVLVDAVGSNASCSNQLSLKIDIEKNDEKVQVSIN